MVKDAHFFSSPHPVCKSVPLDTQLLWWYLDSNFLRDSRSLSLHLHRDTQRQQGQYHMADKLQYHSTIYKNYKPKWVDQKLRLCLKAMDRSHHQNKEPFGKWLSSSLDVQVRNTMQICEGGQ